MSIDTSILDFLWGIVSIPIVWCYKINQRLTKVETTQDIKIDRLNKIENQLCILVKEVNEIKGILREHLRG